MLADPPPRQFAGGLANLNHLIHLAANPTCCAAHRWATMPAGSHDMAREHRIPSRSPDALPLCRAASCWRRTILDHRPALPDLEYRAGLVIRGEHVLPDLAHRPEIGARLSQVLLETMAAIHAVDTAAVGLDDLTSRGFSPAPSPGCARGWAAKDGRTRCIRPRRLAEQHSAAGRPARSCTTTSS